MKIYAPDYYSQFKCIADRCKHSCCVGGEIDIDEESLERYKRLDGELGEWVRKNISFNAECPHFMTDNNERCLFLNESGLCDMITELGEESLCEICALHPRFRNFYSDRVEIGLGLSCEAAAGLILSQTHSVNMVELEDSDAEEEQADLDELEFFETRKGLISVIQNRDIPIFRRLTDIKEAFGVGYDTSDMANAFRELEYMDAEFGNMLSRAFSEHIALVVKDEWEVPLEQLALYFIMRHTADGLYGDDIPERVAFCSLCVDAVYRCTVIRMKEEGLTFFEALCDTARVFSSEIEYSVENTDKLIELIAEMNL